MGKADNTTQVLLTNIVSIDLNVLGPLLKDRICRYLDGTFVVAVKGCRPRCRNTQLPEKTPEVYNIPAGVRHRSILCLCAG